MFDPSTLNCNSVVNKFGCLHEFSFHFLHDEQVFQFSFHFLHDEQVYLPL